MFTKYTLSITVVCACFLAHGAAGPFPRAKWKEVMQRLEANSVAELAAALPADSEEKQEAVLQMIESFGMRCLPKRMYYDKETKPLTSSWSKGDQKLAELCACIGFNLWDRIKPETLIKTYSLVSNFPLCSLAIEGLAAAQHESGLRSFAQAIRHALDVLVIRALYKGRYIGSQAWMFDNEYSGPIMQVDMPALRVLLEKCLLSAPNTELYALLSDHGADNIGARLTLFEDYVIYTLAHPLTRERADAFQAVAARMTPAQYSNALERLHRCYLFKSILWQHICWNPDQELDATAHARITPLYEIGLEIVERTKRQAAYANFFPDSGFSLGAAYNNLASLFMNTQTTIGNDDKTVLLELLRNAYAKCESDAYGFNQHWNYWPNVLKKLHALGVKPNTEIDPDNPEDKRTLFFAYLMHLKSADRKYDNPAAKFETTFDAVCRLFTQDEFQDELIKLLDSQEFCVWFKENEIELNDRKADSVFLQQLVDTGVRARTYQPSLFGRLVPKLLTDAQPAACSSSQS